MTATHSPVERAAEPSATLAHGFRAAAVAAGIKVSGRPDLGVLVSEVACVAAATFTQNAFAAAPVVLDRQRIASGRAQAIVFNSGNANACTGQGGLDDAREMARLAAERLALAEPLVLVASTGVIGQRLPMDRVRAGLARIEPRPDGGHAAAEGIMTTDSHPKQAGALLDIGGREVRIGAMGKGVGMIHPDMATMLAFVATDAALQPAFARAALKRSVDRTFNQVSVDGDTSTNDSCFLLANGLAGHGPLGDDSKDAAHFQQALDAVCEDLARQMARDGEGATRLIQVDVTGARTLQDARAAARAVVRSNLLKAAVHGQDPNWGRVFMAVGNSGARVDPARAALWIGALQVVRDGVGLGVARADASAQMADEEVHFRVDLGLGEAAARAWGCDLSEQYVIENSAYTT